MSTRFKRTNYRCVNASANKSVLHDGRTHHAYVLSMRHASASKSVMQTTDQHITTYPLSMRQPKCEQMSQSSETDEHNINLPTINASTRAQVHESRNKERNQTYGLSIRQQKSEQNESNMHGTDENSTQLTRYRRVN